MYQTLTENPPKILCDYFVSVCAGARINERLCEFLRVSILMHMHMHRIMKTYKYLHFISPREKHN